MVERRGALLVVPVLEEHVFPSAPELAGTSIFRTSDLRPGSPNRGRERTREILAKHIDLPEQ